MGVCLLFGSWTKEVNRLKGGNVVEGGKENLRERPGR